MQEKLTEKRGVAVAVVVGAQIREGGNKVGLIDSDQIAAVAWRKVNLQQREDFQFVDEPYFAPVGPLGDSCQFPFFGAVTGDYLVGFAMIRNLEDYRRAAFRWFGHGYDLEMSR